jgi:hypothetical protein
VRVLSKLFRRLMIEQLVAAHAAGQLTFHGAHTALVNTQAFAAYLAPLKRTRWYVYAKRPLAGPEAVLAYLSRYTHRVAISNRRLIAADAKTVTFKVKDYRINGPARYKTMTLDAHEFIRRFLSHVLPTGFHRIRPRGAYLLCFPTCYIDMTRVRPRLCPYPFHIPRCREKFGSARENNTFRQAALAQRCAL